MLDKSASMDDPTASGRSKWDVITRSLVTFVNDPKSAGIGAGLGFFGLGSGTDTSCTATDYAGCTLGTTEYVCIGSRRVCSKTALEHSAGACEPCVSDAHCQQGSRCVQRLDPADAGAYLCTATQTTCN